MSRTVDNRVVEMQFKNAEFERGINQTITSLNSLEKALNINTKSLDMSGVQREMNNLNLSKITQAVEALSDRFSNLGVIGMTVLQRLTNNAIDLVSRINSATFGQILTGGKARAQKVADAKFKLDGMLETAEDLETVMGSASKAVDGTAFGLDSAASIASMLVGSGVSYTKTLGEGADAMSDLDVALRGVAGAAAMSGASFDTIGYIFTQVKAAGKLMGQDMMQLQTRGINVTAELSKSLGKTQEEVKDMVSSGQISFEMFADAMNKSFGDQAFKSNETLQGVLANVRAALSRIGEIFYSGIIENKDLIDFLNVLRQAINRVKKDIEAFRDPFKNLISSIGKLGSSILGPFIKGEDDGHKPIKVISSIINALANGMQKIADFIDAASKKISDFFNDTGLTDVVKEVSETTDKIEEEMDKIRTMASEIWFGDETGKNPYGNGQEREDALGDMYEKVQRYVNAMKAADFDMAKADEIYGATAEETSEKVVTAKDKERQARERAIQMQAEESKKAKKKESTFALFNSILNIAKQISKAFKNVFNFQIIKDDLHALSNAFKNLFGSFKMTEDRAIGVQGVFEGLFSIIELIRSTVMKLITGALNLLAPVLSKVIDVFFDLGSRLGGVLKRFKEFVVNSDLLGRAGRFLVTAFTKVKNTVGEFFAKFKELPAVQKLKEEFIDIYQNVGNKLIDWFGKGKDAVGGFFGSFGDADTSTMDKILTSINDALEKFIELSDKSSSNITNFIAKFKEGGSINDSVTKAKEMFGEYTKISKLTSSLKKSKGPVDFINNLDRAVTGGGGGGMAEHVSNGLNQIAQSFKNLDVAKVTLIGVSGVVVGFAMVFMNFINKTGDAIKAFTALPQSLVGVFQNISLAIGDFRKIIQRKNMAKMIREVAISIAIMAAALFALTFADTDKLTAAAVALGSMMSVLALIIYLFSRIIKQMDLLDVEKWNATVNGLSLMMISFAGSVFLLSAALLMLSEIAWGSDSWKSIVTLIGIMASLIGVTFLLNKIAPTFKLAGAWLVLYAASIYILVMSLNKLAELDMEDIWDRMKVLAAAMGLVISVALAGSRLGFGKALGIIVLIGSILLIEIALKKLLKYAITWDEIVEYFDQLSVIFIVLLELMLYMRLLSQAVGEMKGFGAAIIGLIAIIFALTISLRSLAKIENVDTLVVAGLVMTALISIIGLVIALIGKLGQANRIKQAGNLMLKMAAALLGISLVIAFLGSISLETLGQGYLAVLAITVLMIALIATTKYAGNINPKALTSMTVLMAMTALLIALMSFIQDKKAMLEAAAILGLGLVSMGFALYLAGKEAKKCAGYIDAIKAMITGLIVLATAIVALVYLNVEPLTVLSIGAAFAMIFLAFGECARIMFKSFGGITPARLRESKDLIVLMMALLAVVGMSLTLIAFAAGGNYMTIFAAGLAMGAIILSMAALFREINDAVNKANGSGGSQTTINNIQTFNKTVQNFSLIGVSLGLIVALGNGAGEIASAALGLMGVMFVMLEVFKAIDSNVTGGESLNAKLKAFHMMIIDLVGIGIAMALITGFGSDWSEILAAAGGLSLVLVAMGGVFLALDSLVEGNGSQLVGKAGAFALASVALIPAAIAISMLANYQWQNLIGAAEALAIVIAIVTGALVALTAINKVGGIVPMIAAAGLLSITLLAIAYASKIFSKAITGVIEAIYSLTQIDYDLIDTSKLGELVGLMLRFALIAIPGAFAIGAIGAALVVLGAGILAVSVGVAIILSFATKFIKALTALLDEIGRLTAMAPVVVTGINLIGKAIGNFFKMTAQSLALGIVVFLTTLQMNAILIGTAVKNLILTVLDVIFEAKKAMVGKVIDHITDMFKMLEDKLPELMTRFNNVVTIALSSLAENAETYGYYGALIAIGFLDGLMDGIALKAEELTDSVAFLAISTIRAFKQTWDKYKDLVGTSMLGTYSDASSKFWGTLADIAGDDSGFGQYARENERLLKEESQADSAAVDAEYERMAEERAKKKIEAKNKAEVKAINNSDTSQIKDSNARKQQELYNAEKGQAIESAGETVEAHNNELEKIVGGEYSYEDLKNKYGDSIGSLLGIGPQKANESGQEMTRVITQNVANIPQSVRDKLKSEGWQFNEAGTEAFKEIQTGIEDESESSLINFGGLTSQFDGLLHGEGGISDMFGNFNIELGGMAGDGAQEWVNGIDSTLMDPANLDLISKDGVKYADALNNSFTSPEGIDVNSPSKKTIKYANSWLEGLYLGLTSVSWNNKLDEAVINTANSIGDSFNTTAATNGAFAPTIRPVLDTNNMGQYSSFLDVLQNPTTMRLAADSTLAIQSSQDMMVAQQLEAMRGDISRLADKDFSKVLDGVAINVNADTTVDGTVLRKTASNYTIKQINQQEQAILMAKGARG